jgi:glycosyltransferase involved in cell wall biosynthesis
VSSGRRLGLLVPARNAESVIGRLLESARRENAFDEVLVYDDASHDETMNEARWYGAVVIHGDVQVGPSAAKNCLAQHSTCDWVHFHDAGDELAPAFTDRARRWIAEVDCDAVLFAIETRDDVTLASLGSARWDEQAISADPVPFHITHTATNCGIYRRQAFLASGGFDDDTAVRYSEDQAMHLRLALAGCRFRADSHVGTISYRRSGSASAANPIACARAQIEVLNRAAAATGERYADAIGRQAWRLAGVCGSYQDWAAVDRCLAVAAGVGYVDPRHEHWLVRAVAKLDAAAAVRFREAFIRLTKPSLRAGTPIAVQTLEGHVR